MNINFLPVHYLFFILFLININQTADEFDKVAGIQIT